MKVSELWLRTLVNPKLTIEEIAEKLTLSGLEVDNLEIFKNQNQDSILTLKIPANRGDCLSMIGVAREVSAITKLSYNPPPNKNIFPNITDVFPVEIAADSACPNYVGRIVQNINPKKPTPDWMLERLAKAGLRTKSTVVDILNYVMLECGQPMHAFDLGKISSKIEVRFAKNNEKIITLENQDVSLDSNTIIISDQEKPLAIAGIIGGLTGSISDTTTNIFLESAYFNPINIRKTSKALKLRTESSIRYERGVDPLLQVQAMARATQLITEIMGGNVGPLSQKSSSQFLPKRIPIMLQYSRLQKILGITIKEEDVIDILKRLEMELIIVSEGLEVIPPSFRNDILQEDDLIEEIIRIYGLENIPSTIPNAPIWVSSKVDEDYISQLKQKLIDRGYHEAITYSFISKELTEKFNMNQNVLMLQNPISADMDRMRSSLWPGLIQVLLYNIHRDQTRARFFEFGACFFKYDNIDEQKNLLSGIAFGSVMPEQWSQKISKLDYFDIKNDVSALLHVGGKFNDYHFKPSSHPALHPNLSAEIFKGKKSIGFLGMLHPALLEYFDLTENVGLFELEADSLLEKRFSQYKEISKYPAIRRDIAILVNTGVLVDELCALIKEVIGNLLIDLIIFDVYQGKNIPSGSKSIALGLILQHPSQTLVESQINEIMDKVVKKLSDQFNAILRE